MAVKGADLESELIDTVCERIRERLPADQQQPCEAFVRQYYQWVPPEDLADRNPLDLYGAAVAHWNLAQQRAPGEAKVRVYNPEFEQHGWQSPHTVIEIVSDDMPFIVDSVTMDLTRKGYAIHLVIHPVVRIRRDENGHVVDVQDPDTDENNTTPESILHAEVGREHDRELLDELRRSIEKVLDQVRAATEDWQAMRARAIALTEEFDEHPPPGIDTATTNETKAFLGWLANDNFTFLGYREYDLVTEGNESMLRVVEGSGLGILRGSSSKPPKKLSPKAAAYGREPQILLLTKANSASPVHRPAYLDYIGVKKYAEDGTLIGERRFLGLYTTAAYKASPRTIPIIRGTVQGVVQQAGFPPASHDRKALEEILEAYPRDSLFQMETEELFNVAIGILGLGERQRLRLFMWRDPLDRFVECLVCIPRDRFNTENRERVGRILLDALGGVALDWTLQLSESRIARVHYIIRCGEGPANDYDAATIEGRLVQAVRAWTDDLRDALLEDHGEEDGTKLFKRYERAFPAGYQADWVARSAVADIGRIEELASTDDPIITSLYRPLEAPEGMVRLKLFSSGDVLLSDVLPTLEHLGAKVADERPYEITTADGGSAWIYDFGLQADPTNTERVRDLLHDAFLGVWRGELEDDGLNGLVLGATLTGRQVSIVRAVAKYLRQAGLGFSDAYIERTVIGHPDIARMLVELFNARLDPSRHDDDLAEKISTEIEEALDAIPSLDEDRIMRAFLSVIRAIVRTNAFQPAADGKPHPYLSFKLDSEQIPVLPLPRPQYEIFVYSPRVEAVHLRGGKVARGGIRWSDRREDFRTEVLGLMKAQMVKNALIVPVGAKGGFVLKRPPQDGGREALLQEGIACYTTFLSGLLDVTDNIVEGEVVPPKNVVRYDDDDPYLVVAADKGTATFSDIANGISSHYGFWLGDAFASGGSQGYDHKAMGITARGAWESVKRHFRELGTDIQTTDFTVAGIGDMAGDVFGNGMLLSEHIKLIAAFNHIHIFIDPDPDPEKSYAERKRLFELPRSAWSDYEESLISEGGGVYSRTAKSIKLSPQAREVLNIDGEKTTPNELIQAILRAPVDLFYNGGIGTYVKASTESNADVGDKANDALRIDARDLQCRVVGEGGNLGFTQRARIEYSLTGGPEHKGGRINTDAIDNAAGVNCSDHEVNIKILLDGLVADGDMTSKQRNELLAEMTDAVGEQVLYGSYTQTQAVSLALAQAASMVDVHARLIRHLEQTAGLNRKIEFLPVDDVIDERKAAHQGLVAPELGVVMAYQKIHLYKQLLESDLPEDAFLAHDLERYFPPPLGSGAPRHPASEGGAEPNSSGPDHYADQMRNHRLRREIIATVVANQLVDRAGTTFSFRLLEETGALPAVLARAYAAAREVLDMRSYWDAVESLDNQVSAATQLEMLIEARRLVERSTRWLIRANPYQVSIAQTIRRFRPGGELLAAALPDALEGSDREAFDGRAAELEHAGVPAELARRAAGMQSMLALFDIVEVAAASERDPEDVLKVYFRLGSRLELNWLRERIIELPRANRWQALARAALRDDLFNLYRELTRKVLETGGADADPQAAIGTWSETNSEVLDRALGMVADIRASRIYDNTTLPVALREIRSLLRGTSRTGMPVGSVTMAE